MFKIICNAIKLRRLNKLVAELCDKSSCRDCPSYIGCHCDSGHLCAQARVLQQALNKWSSNKEVNK